jgi:hypothetical protein
MAAASIAVALIEVTNYRLRYSAATTGATTDTVVNGDVTNNGGTTPDLVTDAAGAPQGANSRIALAVAVNAPTAISPLTKYETFMSIWPIRCMLRPISQTAPSVAGDAVNCMLDAVADGTNTARAKLRFTSSVMTSLWEGEIEAVHSYNK